MSAQCRNQRDPPPEKNEKASHASGFYLALGVVGYSSPKPRNTLEQIDGILRSRCWRQFFSRYWRLAFAVLTISCSELRTKTQTTSNISSSSNTKCNNKQCQDTLNSRTTCDITLRLWLAVTLVPTNRRWRGFCSRG